MKGSSFNRPACQILAPVFFAARICSRETFGTESPMGNRTSGPFRSATVRVDSGPIGLP